jgi:hypothetical protein
LDFPHLTAVSIRAEFMMSVTSPSRFIPVLTRLAGIAAAYLCLAGVGCDKQQSNAERIKGAYESAGMKVMTVYPLAGTVTLDDQPPAAEKSKRWAIVVMAYDASKPDQPARNQAFVTAKSDGSFTFGDGLPAGKYVMLFAGLDYNKKRGWQGPDTLKNLYNDPDVNAKKPGFLIELPPAKADYSVNLNVAGETPSAQPSPKALTHIPR